MRLNKYTSSFYYYVDVIWMLIGDDNMAEWFMKISDDDWVVRYKGK